MKTDSHTGGHITPLHNTELPISDIKPEDKCPRCGWQLCNPINDESLICGNPSCAFWGTVPDVCPECQGTKIIEGRLTDTGEDATCWRCKDDVPSRWPDYDLQKQVDKAIDILDGNADPIDWRDKTQPELLRKLCEHLEAFNYKRGQKVIPQAAQAMACSQLPQGELAMPTGCASFRQWKAGVAQAIAEEKKASEILPNGGMEG